MERRQEGEDDDRPELLIKLQERKRRHKERSLLHRVGVVLLGLLIVAVGVVLSGPGVPGPGIAVIVIGVGFLALEFDWAERLLERVIVWA
ncbi:MAG: PGPGW domain-containing protein, partial [Thermoleophilaceae bacterium]